MDKLKVGDRVRIKTVEEMKKCAKEVRENGIFCDLEIQFGDDCPSFVENMIPLCGTYATVERLLGPDFEHVVKLTDFSSDADTHWVYCDYMLEKVNDKEETKTGHDAETTVCDEFKVGDLVKFKTIEEMRKCSTNPNGTSDIIRFPKTRSGLCFVIDERFGMQHLCGTYATIKAIDGRKLILTDFTSKGSTNWSYCDSMVTKVDKKELELNEIIEQCHANSMILNNTCTVLNNTIKKLLNNLSKIEKVLREELDNESLK